MILRESAAKLSSIFSKYCSNPQLASLEAKVVIDEIYNSLGGCEVCFGRGYKLLDEYYDYCECQRGKELKKFIENRE